LLFWLPDNTSVEAKFSAKLLQMARKMRMNTEARKNLFCALMSADDYLDAFERLVKVDKAAAAAGTRERDTAFVLMACCLKEVRTVVFFPIFIERLNYFVLYCFKDNK
jgi:nucleolar MIF4G domain-containing protein 1